MHNLVFCLMGPTAIGKTDLAASLITQFPFEVISVDSAMIYRGLDIGSAKPDRDFLKRVPHHLIDIVDPIDSYSVAEFCADCDKLCGNILKKGRYPLLVGGTMMYFNGFQEGLSELPQADSALREKILGDAKKYGWQHMYEKLMTVDPKSRIHPNDKQRIQRALEVFELTNKPLSSLQQKLSKANYQFVNLALVPQERVWLHERIAERFQQMLAQGLVDEIKSLISQWQLNSNHPSMRCVGYRQVFKFLNGEYTYDHMQQKGIVATRQLAKRQLTWLRSWQDKLVFHVDERNITREIADKIKFILDAC